MPSQWDGASSKVSWNKYHTNFDDVVEELILDLDPNHDGEITEEEFYLIFKYIQ